MGLDSFGVSIRIPRCFPTPETTLQPRPRASLSTSDQSELIESSARRKLKDEDLNIEFDRVIFENRWFFLCSLERGVRKRREVKGNIQRVREEVRGEEESRGRCELVDSKIVERSRFEWSGQK